MSLVAKVPNVCDSCGGVIAAGESVTVIASCVASDVKVYFPNERVVPGVVEVSSRVVAVACSKCLHRAPTMEGSAHV